MEAVPRLWMLSCELKVSPSNTEFGPFVKKYIRENYQENPDSYKKEIRELENLRQSACKVSRDFTGCSILKRYYCQLLLFQNRFPVKDTEPNISFMWCDIYSGTVFNISDIKYEQACILYNIGALHSQLGASDSRSTVEGMKITCTHFQCAAWAFQHLRDFYSQPKDSDMSHDLLSFIMLIMLAQAQECILEKSMLDNRKSLITAKVAAQVVNYYKSALEVLTYKTSGSDSSSFLDIVGSKTFKAWKKYVEFKMSYYSGISHYYMGNNAEDQQKMGERVAWYQSAYEHLNEAIKISQTMERDDLSEALAFLTDVIGGKYNSSKKENDFVYHEKVPAVKSLPEVVGASLVKGIAFDPTDPDVCGADIFARLIPMEAHTSSSLYSEEKAKLLRSVTAKIENKNEELMTYLSSLQLDKLNCFEKNEAIPEKLFEICAAMSVQPDVVSDLICMLKDLDEASNRIETALKLSHELLIEEEVKEKKHQEIFGKRVPSMIIVELKKEYAKYEEAQKKAIESNTALKKAVEENLDNLKLLSGSLESVKQALPSISTIKTPEVAKSIQEFQILLSKIDEMKNQRQFLEDQLREALHNDDITHRLIAVDKTDDIQKVFVDELKKHDQCIAYLNQNFIAQDNILHALTECNASSASSRKLVMEISEVRAQKIQSLIDSYMCLEGLTLKAKEGVEFYEKLQANVSRLLNRIQSVTRVQEEERTQIAEVQITKGMASNSPVSTKDNQLPNQPLKSLNYPSSLKMKDHGQKFTGRHPNETVILSNQHSKILSANESVVPFQHPEKNIWPSVLPPKNTNIHAPADFGVEYSIEKTNLLSMGPRPSPVGSEETVPPTTCLTDSVCFSASSYIPAWNMPMNPVTSNTMFNAPHLPPVPEPNMHLPTFPAYSPYSISNQVMQNVATFCPPVTANIPPKPAAIVNQNLYSVSSSSEYDKPKMCYTTPSISHDYSSLGLSYCNENIMGNQLISGYECKTPLTFSSGTSSHFPTMSPVFSSGISNITTQNYISSAPNNTQLPVSSVKPEASMLSYNYTSFPEQHSVQQYIPPQLPSEFHQSIDNQNYIGNQQFCNNTLMQTQSSISNSVITSSISECKGSFSYTEPLPSSLEQSLPLPVTAAVDKNVPHKELLPISSPNHSLSKSSPDHPAKVIKTDETKINPPQVTSVTEKLDLKSTETNQILKDPLDDPGVQAKFIADVEKYEKMVETLVRKSLNGTTPLDQKWKEFIDSQERESRSLSISVARCYSLKNRIPDFMPYDHNRVKLTMSKDDYINASYLKDIVPGSPVFVITQSPLPTTYNDFWIMIWELQVETLVCLLPDSELKSHIYWPKRGQTLTYGLFEISLHNIKEKNNHIERIINVTHIKSKISRVVVHLQFTSWNSSDIPSSPAPTLQFVSEVLNYHKQQRNLLRPVVVHCSAGVGRSGAFCLITALVAEMNNGHSPRDVAQIAIQLSQQRKFLIHDKSQLKFCYDAILYYAQDKLMRRGILTNKASFENKRHSPSNSTAHTRHPSEDFILGAGSLAKLQSGIAGLGLSESVIASSNAADSTCKENKHSESSALENNKSNNEAPSERFSLENSISTVNDCSIKKNTDNIPLQKHDTEITPDLICSVTDNKSETLSFVKPEADTSKLLKSDDDVPEDCTINNVTSILDPSKFTLDCPASPAKRRITKETFANSVGKLSNSATDTSDPLSKLDPLWSLKKK